MTQQYLIERQDPVNAGMVGVDTARVVSRVTNVSDWWDQEGTITTMVRLRADEIAQNSGQAHDATEVTYVRKSELGTVSQRGGYVAVEASIPKHYTGANISPAAVADVKAWCSEVWTFLHGSGFAFPTLGDEPEQWFTRVDCVRDFYGVDAPVAVISAQAGAPGLGAASRSLYVDGTSGGAQTCAVRTPSGKIVARLYDKHAETPVPAAEGVVRFEAQSRRGYLKAKGIGIPRLLEDDHVRFVARERFDRCKMGNVIRPLDSALAAITAAADLTDGERLQMIGAIVLAKSGHEDLVGNKQRRSRLRSKLQKAGVWFTSEAFSADEVVRLDFERGYVRETVGQSTL